jgi:hypothetical protein
MADDTLIPIEYLRECFDCDFATGFLTWKHRPREHFVTKRGWSIFNVKYAGKLAGTLHVKGYLVVRLTFNGREFLLGVHRVVFALAHGRWPMYGVDHRNGVRSANNLNNLREATNAQN